MKIDKVFGQLKEEDQTMFVAERFIRWGGLSATPHDLHYKHRKDYYHTPPAKKGIFCFLDGYVEEYLFNWKMTDKEESHLKRRNFSYRGKIWTHMKVESEDIIYYRSKGSWH